MATTTKPKPKAPIEVIGDAILHILGDIGTAPIAIGKEIGKGVNNLFTPPAPKKPAAKKKTAAKGATAPTAQQIEQQIQAQDVWGKLGQGLVADQQKLENPILQAMGGGLTGPATSVAANTALGAMGLSPTDSAAKWLHSEIKQANANDSPLQAAMNSYAAAFATGQQGVDQALTNLGQANQQFVETAPNATWLQEIAQHISSNINYTGQIPSYIANSLPDWTKWYLQQSGAGGFTPGGSGGVPITSLNPAGAATLAPGSAAAIHASNGLPSTATGAAGAAPGVIPAGTGSAPS